MHFSGVAVADSTNSSKFIFSRENSELFTLKEYAKIASDADGCQYSGIICT